MDFSALYQWIINLQIAKIAPVIGIVIAVIVNFPKIYAMVRGVIVKIEIKQFTLVEREPGLVDFQLNLCMHALYGKVVVKGIYLVNKHKFHLLYNESICLYNEPDNNTPSNKAIIKLAMPMIDFEFTQFVEDKFKELLCKKLEQSQVNVLGFEILENSFKCLTMAGRLKGKLDGIYFSNISLENWSVLVEYGTDKWTRTTKTELMSSIIDNEKTIY